MSKGFHCLGCHVDGVLVTDDGYHFGCSGRVIPIATICSEPTVIDESDLAPGMVVVAVDAGNSAVDAWLCSPDARLHPDGIVMMADGCYLADTRLGETHDVDGWIRRVAGPRRPC